MPNGQWRFYIDRGGTFTDIVAEAPDGALSSLKLLSDDPRYDDAALEGIRRFLGVETNTPIPHARIDEVRMGTTVATNALLTRNGERTLLVTTRGFRDQLRIGYQNRPKLFALNIELPDMLYARVIEADERMDAEGDVLHPLEEAPLREATAGSARGRHFGLRHCVHAWLSLSRRMKSARRRSRARKASRKSRQAMRPCRLMKFVSRGDTTVADAYLSPVLSR